MTYFLLWKEENILLSKRIFLHMTNEYPCIPMARKKLIRRDFYLVEEQDCLLLIRTLFENFISFFQKLYLCTFNKIQTNIPVGLVEAHLWRQSISL